MAGQVHLTRDGAVASVTLDHPGRMNAISRAMWREIAQVFARLQGDDDLRAVVVRGAGGHFAAGADIDEFPSFRFDPQALQAYHEELVAPALQAMLDCDAPVLAAIDGVCVGGGLEVAACCDWRIASARSRFGLPIARLGFPLAPGEMRLMLQRFGRAALVELLWHARVLDAQAAHARGLVHEVADAEPLAERIEACLQQWQSLSPLALRINKRTLRLLEASGLDEAQRRAHFAYADAHDHREGIQAFIDKRPPSFTGR